MVVVIKERGKEDGKEKKTWTSTITAPLLPVLDIGFALVARSDQIRSVA